MTDANDRSPNLAGLPPLPIVSLADVTDRVVAEREREFLLQASEVLASTIDYEATLAAVTRLAVQGIADWCAVDELAPDGQIRRISVAHPDPEMVALAHELVERYPPDPNAPRGAARVIRTGEAELVPEIPDELLVSVARDEEHLRIIRALGLTSYISVPLIARDQILGAVTLVTSSPQRRFGPRDLQLAQEIARRAAVAIDNARLYRESEEARTRLEEQAIHLEAQAEELQTTQAELELANNELQEANTELELKIEEAEEAVTTAHAAGERLRLLVEAGALLGGSLDFQVTLDSLSRLIVPLVADWCFVEMAAPDGSVELVAVHHVDPARVAGARRVLSRYPVDPAAPHATARVLRTGEPELVPEIPDSLLQALSQSEEHLELLRSSGFHSYVSVPLIVRGNTIGVLSLVTAESGRRLGEDDLVMAQELARRASLAIDNARLYAAEQAARWRAERASDRSRRLQAIAAALNQAATPEQVAAVCVGEGMDALAATAGSLALLDPEGDSLRIVNSSGFTPAVVDRWRRFPLSPGRPLSDALLQRTPILVGTRQEWMNRYPSVLPDMVEAGALGFAAIPLVVGSEAIAGLSFCFARERTFDEADRGFLVTLGEQTAQALERARLFEAEREARMEAEVANRAKTDFLSAMSHELRTPLNAIAGYLDLLELGVRGPLTELQLADLRRIKHAQDVLLGLISDILSFARIEAGRIEFSVEVLPLLELLGGLEEMVGPQLAAKNLQYRCDPGAEPLFVLADAERLRQILINLLSNAVKFTDVNGSVEVVAWASEGSVMVRVSDTGRGIPAEKLESIFDPFVQIGRGIALESQQGVGLGLAISRELARGMGGDLTVESVLGEGSVFTLVLPQANRREDDTNATNGSVGG